eukprot:3854850-Heterocapsa_arctica.AAC.1
MAKAIPRLRPSVFVVVKLVELADDGANTLMVKALAVDEFDHDDDVFHDVVYDDDVDHDHDIQLDVDDDDDDRHAGDVFDEVADDDDEVHDDNMYDDVYDDDDGHDQVEFEDI